MAFQKKLPRVFQARSAQSIHQEVCSMLLQLVQFMFAMKHWIG